MQTKDSVWIFSIMSETDLQVTSQIQVHAGSQMTKAHLLLPSNGITYISYILMRPI